MNISAADRIQFQNDLGVTRNDSRLIYGLLPVLTRTAFDTDTQSGNDMSSGSGLGETVSSWKTYALRVHFRNVDSMLMTYGHVPPGVILGDLLVNFGPRDLDVFNQLYANENSYLILDGDVYHIMSITADGMGMVSEWAADCRHFSPNFLAPGYGGEIPSDEILTEDGTSFWQFDDGSSVEWG